MEASAATRGYAAPTWRTHRWRSALPLVCVTALGAAVRLASFGRVPGNPYYDAAVRSMGLSWRNLFYGAYDPAGQVSIDKPPADLWMQVASVKLFGFNSIALRLPEVLSGVLAVALLYDVVRRLFGARAAIVSALALALLPVAVLTARSDTMDSLMMLLIVAAAWLVVRASQMHRVWLLVVAGAVMGIAFNVKLFEALIALPALVALTWLSSDLPARRRLSAISLMLAGLVVVALSWIVAASLALFGRRPFPIGSSAGSLWQVVFGYNGIDRLRGTPSAYLRHFDPAGPGRLFSSGGRHFGVLIGVSLVPALAFGALALLARLTRARARSAPSTSSEARLRRSGGVFITTWLLTGTALFSAAGRMQIRYLEAMTPAVAAATGVAFDGLARAALRRASAAAALAGGALVSALVAPRLGVTAWWVAPLALTSAVIAALAAVTWRHPRAAHARREVVALAACATLVAALAAPTAQTLAVSGSNETSAQLAGTLAPAKLDALSRFLRAHQSGARYEVASSNAGRAAALITRDARPVLMLTSLHNHPLLTVAQLAAHVRAGDVRYLLIGRGACVGGDRCPPVLRWARRHSVWVRAPGGVRMTSLARFR